MQTSVESLAKNINDQESSYEKINKTLDSIIKDIDNNKNKLQQAKNDIQNLEVTSKSLQKQKQEIENNVTEYVLENFAMTMGIEQAKKESLKDIINKEVYTLVFENSKQEVLDLNVQYIKINSKTRSNEDEINRLEEYIKKQEEKKDRYIELEQKQLKALDSLKIQHKLYQNALKETIDKQNSIKNILSTLNILKDKEVKKEQERIKKEKEEQRKRELALKKKKEEEDRRRKLQEKKKKEALEKAKEQEKQSLAQENNKDQEIQETKEIKLISRKNLDEDIDIEVKKLGSSTKGIKISKYNGPKSFAPIKAYEIVKKFGKYYDKVYKMELFNESVAMKTKYPDAKVYSIFRGQVVYVKENSGLLENVVIVKHKNNLHTIYSHLDKISPTIKVGKWIPKGYVVGRINDTLYFQATKNSQYIDPQNLFK